MRALLLLAAMLWAPEGATRDVDLARLGDAAPPGIEAVRSAAPTA